LAFLATDKVCYVGCGVTTGGQRANILDPAVDRVRALARSVVAWVSYIGDDRSG
jgi:hypothetical protein